MPAASKPPLQTGAERDKLVLQYHNLVHHIAIRLLKVPNIKQKASHDDLVQEGCIALIRAAERFDANRGVKFITYAYRAIQRQMWAFANRHSGVIHVPDSAYTLEANRHSAAMVKSFGVRKECAMRAQSIRRLTGNLDLPEKPRKQPDTLFVSKVARLVKRFPNLRMRRIVRARLLYGDRPRPSLQDLADREGLTKERIRQIEAEGLELLRAKLGGSYGDADE